MPACASPRHCGGCSWGAAPSRRRSSPARGDARVNVSPSYGMTEACSQIATDGVALLGTELQIADDGEVLVRGRTVATGTLGPDGWLHTGDLGAFDNDGRLVIVGRKADTIVSGGENVAPAEVESVLLEHPAVADAAVLGRADPEWGEAVVAQVVLADGRDRRGRGAARPLRRAARPVQGAQALRGGQQRAARCDGQAAAPRAQLTPGRSPLLRRRKECHII